MKRKPRPETFVSWLTAAAPRGRSMREYIERFGAVSPRAMIESARERCWIEVEIKQRGTHTRMYAKGDS